MSSRPNFDALRELHNSANDLLHSPITERGLAHRQQEKYVSEASLRVLDVRGTTKDVLLLVKDHLQELQSTFRKISLGETAVENKFAGYCIHRKKLKKEMLNCLRLLKGMRNNCIVNSDSSKIDRNLVAVVNALREVRVTTICTVESLMSLMSMPNPICKSNRGSFRSKFMRVNSLSLWENCDTTMFEFGNKRLEAVEIVMEDLEVELECIFRRLICTRVSLLNILTTWLSQETDILTHYFKGFCCHGFAIDTSLRND